MKCRLQFLLPAILLLCAAGVGTGSPVFLVIAAMLIFLIVGGFLSVLWTVRTITIRTELPDQVLQRGRSSEIHLYTRHKCLLPVAPILLEITSAPGAPAEIIVLPDAGFREQHSVFRFTARHVGQANPGIQAVTVSDIMGIFTKSWMPEKTRGELLTLPLTFGMQPLEYSPGDPGMGTMARASEDLTFPEDIRSYQPGDAMKKIHWKLSARKNELLVRKYEEPILLEALVLMDCSPPPHWGHPEAEADIRDTMLEAAASILLMPEENGHTVRMPLFGTHPVEITSQMPDSMILEHLARVDFSETDRFERVLSLEMPRVRQVGSVVVISARLSGSMVEMMTRIRRMGPIVRLYFVTFSPDDGEAAPFIKRLQHASCEVCYVMPEPVPSE